LSRAVTDPDPEISRGPSLKKYFFWPRSATEGSGPGRGKLELSNVRAVAGQRFILKES